MKRLLWRLRDIIVVHQDRCAECRHPLHLHIPPGQCHWRAVPHRQQPTCDCPGYTTKAAMR